MKMPFPVLAVLLFFVAAPFGLMQLTTKAIQAPPRLMPHPAPTTYPLMSTSPDSGFVFFHAIGHALAEAIEPCFAIHDSATAINQTVTMTQRRIADLKSSRRLSQDSDIEWFTLTQINMPYSLHGSSIFNKPTIETQIQFPNIRIGNIDVAIEQSIPGLIASARRAIANSWAQWQPTLAALPDDIRSIDRQAILMRWQDDAALVVASLSPASLSPASLNPASLNPGSFGTTITSPTATRSPLPVIAKQHFDVPTILYSAAKSLSADVPRLVTFPSARLTAQAIGKLPNPVIGAARLADRLGVPASHFLDLGDAMRTSMDNR